MGAIFLTSCFMTNLHLDCLISIWGLGCICAELFLGLPVFPGHSEYDQAVGRAMRAISFDQLTRLWCQVCRMCEVLCSVTSETHVGSLLFTGARFVDLTSTCFFSLNHVSVGKEYRQVVRKSSSSEAVHEINSPVVATLTSTSTRDIQPRKPPGRCWIFRPPAC